VITARQLPAVPRLRLHQDLLIDRVQRDHTDVVVHLRARRGTTHWVRFAFPDGPPVGYLRELARWRDECTPLTYVRGQEYGALIDDAALLRTALV
jgi:hypothetical protein